MAAHHQRAPGDHGTAQQALTWALEHNPDGEVEAGSFLRCWSQGDLSEWPEFYKWLAKQSQPIRRLPAVAPKDGTMVWLLVDYTGDQGGAALSDALLAWTIGFNNLDNDGEDRWRFAGWCWSHDHFVEGSGAVIAWSPIGFELEAD